jgi:SAM-dependent methyltransferase
VAGSEAERKRQVRAFYDAIGWQHVGEGVYQNARFEDLRPVSREYIHRCHLRVGRYLPATGARLLDAGCGPIQYPEYLEYSRGYRQRVCLDLSIQALREARLRIGEHGRFVVADMVHLPFRSGAFDGIVSLHALHHVPADEQAIAMHELERTLLPGGRAAVVYSWKTSPVQRWTRLPIALANRVIGWYRRGRGVPVGGAAAGRKGPKNTFTHKHDLDWAMQALAGLPGFEIFVWRSVSTAFLRAFIHAPLLGKIWLRLLYALEERAPRFFGRVGQYPLFAFGKPDAPASRIEREG